MGFFGEELTPLLEVYQRETQELMAEYERLLTLSARENRLDGAAVAGIFRVVHTIKGASAMMGLAELRDCTHRMEDLFLLFRENESRLDGEAGRVLDLLYAYEDYVNGETARVMEEDFAPSAPDALLARIEQALAYFRKEPEQAAAEAPPPAESGAAIPEPAAPPESDAPPENAAPPESDATRWSVRFRKDCQMVNVRAFQLVKRLRPLCESLTHQPSALERQDAAAQIQRDGLLLILRGARLAEAKAAVEASPYVEALEEAEPPRPAPEASAGGAASSGKYSRVAWALLTGLQDLTGDLITAHNLLKNTLEAGGAYRLAESDMENTRRILNDLERLVSAATRTPVSGVTAQYYRVVREMAARGGKKAVFQVMGEELEADRGLLDEVSGALLHLLRNAMDHGIETPAEREAQGKPPEGTVRLIVRSMGGMLRFIVTDDGRGIDPAAILRKARERDMLVKPEAEYTKDEILRFVFTPGFSTNEAVSQYSGRGVGMDVVQKTADDLGGAVRLQSNPGRGSIVVLEVPASATSAECFQVLVGKHLCLLPVRSVMGVYAEKNAALREVGGQLWLQDEALLPVIDLFALFGEPPGDDRRILVVRGMRRSAALRTGAVLEQQTAVEKPLPDLLDREYRTRYGLSGCAVTGTGRLGLVLSAELLLRNVKGGA